MADFACDTHGKRGINERRAEVLETLDPPRHSDPGLEDRAMPCEHDKAYAGGDFKLCPKCEENKPITRFSRSASSKGGRRRVCTDCRSLENFLRKKPTPDQVEAYRKSFKTRQAKVFGESLRWKHLRLKYGLSQVGYEEIAKRQNGRCAICLTDKPGGKCDVLVVDHCHDTGSVRGLLCAKCNTAIGMLGDTPQALARAFLHVAKVGVDAPQVMKPLMRLAADLAEVEA